MKSLRAFWHWVDNEKPAEVGENQFDRLTYEEQRAVGVACELVLERLDSDFDDYDDCACVDWRAFNGLLVHWPAIRDLSFVLCSGIEAMHEAVREPEPPFTSTAQAFLAERYRNEVQLPDVVMNGSMAFRDVDSGRYEGTLAFALEMARPDPRPPHHRGKTSSVYDEETRRLDIYPATCVEALDNIRGYSPLTIALHGEPSYYAADALAYLPNVIGPMQVEGARIETPDCTRPLADWWQ